MKGKPTYWQTTEAKYPASCKGNPLGDRRYQEQYRRAFGIAVCLKSTAIIRPRAPSVTRR
jgi:hypothetical protein